MCLGHSTLATVKEEHEHHAIPNDVGAQIVQTSTNNSDQERMEGYAAERKRQYCRQAYVMKSSSELNDALTDLEE